MSYTSRTVNGSMAINSRVIGVTSAGAEVEVLVNADGSVCTATRPETFIIYTLGGYTYYCTANVGSALSSAVWQVTRRDDATGNMISAGDGLHSQIATDAATVAALTYTLGA